MKAMLRRVCGPLASISLLVALAGLPLWAGCGESDDSCDTWTTWCEGFCVDLQTDSKNCGACSSACKAGEVCTSGACVLSCPSGQSKCGGGDAGPLSCVNLQTDTKNCGACDTACKAGEVCSSGACALSCPGSLSNCSGLCVNLQADAKNCGTCASACKAGEVCSSGSCKFSCPGSLSDCSGLCVDLKTDTKNCGTCANQCKAGHLCSAGACALSCQQGLTDCSGACVNLQTDNANCGTCSTTCKAGHLCGGGVCALSCQQGLTDCSGTCVNLQTDNANCGTCSTTCKGGQICAKGSCIISCSSGLTDCYGACVNLNTDTVNCGNCGNACKTGEKCTVGNCGLNCQSGLSGCSGTCVDLQADSKNCGACGTTCKAGEVCTSGKCAVSCGNGTIDAGEQCDGTALGLLTCKSMGYSGGTLACLSTCGYDTSKCAKCNDKVKNGDETDVDCGGACTGCAMGKACKKSSDCKVGSCSAGTCQYPATCKAQLALDSKSKSGTYTIDPTGGSATDAFVAYCDMTTDGGGWTRCGWIDEVTAKNSVLVVRESSSWIEHAKLMNKSYCAKLYAQAKPQALLVHNLTKGSAYGENQKLKIHWGSSPFTLYSYNNHAISLCKNLTTGKTHSGCRYATHSGWTDTAFSFTVGNLNSGYTSNANRRLILGPTASPSGSKMWHNFGADSNSHNTQNDWVNGYNVGYLYLR